MNNANIQRIAQQFGGGAGHFVEDLHRIADRVGVPVGQITERLGRMFALSPDAVMANLDGLLEVLGVISAPGVTASIWMPGALGEWCGGLQTGNYTLSNGSTGYSAVDGTAGLVLDAAGAVAPVVTANTLGVGAWSGAPSSGTVSAGTWSGMALFATTPLTATLTVGKTYRVTGAGTSSGLTDFRSLIGTLYGTFSASFDFFFVATNAFMVMQANTASESVSLSSFTVTEVTGIHATQATTANKPAVRRGLYNLLTYSNKRTNGAWSGSGVTVNTDTNITVTATGYNFEVVASSPGTVYTTAALLWGTPGTIVNLYLQDGAGAFASSGIDVTLTATPTVYVWSRTAVEAYIYAGIRGNGGTPATVNVESQGIFQGTLTAAQILAEGGIPLTTATAASNPSAGRYWLGTDSGDSLALGSVPFQFTDDFFVCVGAACNNKAVYPGVFESLGGTARIYSYFDAAGIAVTQFKDDAGTSTYIVGPAFSDGASVVLSSYKQSGQVCTGLNGTDGTPQAAPAGTFTLSSSKLLNGLDGKMAAVVIIKGQVSAADRLTIERWVASLTPNGPTF